MPRIRTPNHELTAEQLKKRTYNERYRARINEKSIEKIPLIEQSKKIEKKTQRLIEKNHMYAMASNDYTGNFSNDEKVISQSNYSNVLSFPVREKEGERENFSNEVLIELRMEIEKLRQEVALLKSREQVPTQSEPRPSPKFSIKRALLAAISFIVITPIPALLVWQMKEMIELTGNSGGLFLAAGLEYAVLIAAGAAGLAKTLWQKMLGLGFVLIMTTIMGLFVVSGVQKRDVTGSETYKRLTEERQMMVTDRAMFQDQLVGMPTDYKSKRAEIQAKIEAKTSAIATVGAKIETIQKSGGNENPLATLANIASRLVLMLLEAWLVLGVISTIHRGRKVSI